MNPALVAATNPPSADDRRRPATEIPRIHTLRAYVPAARQAAQHRPVPSEAATDGTDPVGSQPLASLPEEMLLCCADEITGTVYVNRMLCGMLVAAAGLGELLLAEAITITHGRIGHGRRDTTLPHAAALLRDKLDQDRSVQSVRAWVTVLAPNAYTVTGTRLIGSGHAQLRRRSVFRAPTYVASDPNTWMLPRVRLGVLLCGERPLTRHDRMLCGLIHTGGLTARVLPDQPAAQRRLAAAAADLPAPERDLLAHTAAATAAAVLARTL